MTLIATSCVLFALSLSAWVTTVVVFARRRGEQARQTAKLIRTAAALQESLQQADRLARETQERRRWLGAVLRESDDILLAYTVDAEQIPAQFVDANNNACHLLGYTREQLLSMSPLDVETFHHPPLQDDYVSAGRLSLVSGEGLGRDTPFARWHMQALARQAIKDGVVQYDGNFVARNGTLIPTRVVLRNLELDGQPCLVCCARGRASAGRGAAESPGREAITKELINQAPIGIAIYDGQRELKAVNNVCLRMFGCPDQDEFRHFNLLENPYLPDAWRERMKSETAGGELTVDFGDVRKRGLFVTSRAGRGVFDMLVSHLGVEADFTPRGCLVFVQDITERKGAEAELAAMEKQLQQAQKMQVLGTLAGGIAHDFNNVLTPILGYAELALIDNPAGTSTHDSLQQIIAASLRAKDLVQQILVFSRKGEGPQDPIHLTPIIKEVVKQVGAVAPPGICAQCVVRTEADRALANPTQIHQVLMNLCANAMYAMRDSGGTLEIAISNSTLGTLHRREFPSLVTPDYLRGAQKGRFVRISVRDTGCGMDAATMENIFEPFFTTKPAGEGTGMGLATVRGIVTSLGGAVSVESKVGKGTAFHVVLPLVAEEPKDDLFAAAPAVTSKARILFVDDDVTIATLAERMLTSLGYSPTVVTHSPQALDLFRKSPAAFDVVVTDQVMPEMSGGELTRALLAIRPDLPVVLCTGFSARLSPDEAKQLGIREFVMKPIERRDLALSIEKAMAK
jgi:signal transduction histidine kinase